MRAYSLWAGWISPGELMGVGEMMQGGRDPGVISEHLGQRQRAVTVLSHGRRIPPTHGYSRQADQGIRLTLPIPQLLAKPIALFEE